MQETAGSVFRGVKSGLQLKKNYLEKEHEIILKIQLA